MTRRAFPASSGLVSRCWASVIRPFHKVQPRPRAQVARSSGSAARSASLLVPCKSVQAIDRSHAGSPTAEDPKSMTALNRPLLTKRLPALTSPWTQTGEPRHAAPTGGGPAGGVDPLQGNEELRQRGRELAEIGDMPGRRGFAFEPAVDGP